MNQRIAKSFYFRPLTDVLTPKSGLILGQISHCTELNASQIPRGVWAVLELTGTLPLCFLLNFLQSVDQYITYCHNSSVIDLFRCLTTLPLCYLRTFGNTREMHSSAACVFYVSPVFSDVSVKHGLDFFICQL